MVMSRSSTQFTEASVAHCLAFQLFNSKSVLVIPNCKWTGNETDLLIIEPGLRIIDVEIKISRSDLKADAKKDKWWKHRPYSRRHLPKEPRQWPDKVWKHYYALPAAIWSPELINGLPEASGVITLTPNAKYQTGMKLNLVRRAKPCREAKPINPCDAIDLARLASLRMWSSLRRQGD